jgi:hypothetical protein
MHFKIFKLKLLHIEIVNVWAIFSSFLSQQRSVIFKYIGLKFLKCFLKQFYFHFSGLRRFAESFRLPKIFRINKEQEKSRKEITEKNILFSTEKLNFWNFTLHLVNYCQNFLARFWFALIWNTFKILIY